MNRSVFTVSEFLESYHRIGIYPELHDAYPHPTIDDNYSNQMIIREFPSWVNPKLLILTTLIIIILVKRTRALQKASIADKREPISDDYDAQLAKTME